MEEKLKTDLDYVSGQSIIPVGDFKISPSAINNFISKPHEWYREHVLGESGFTGNTASVLGTICHYVAEMIIKKQEVDKKQIYTYIYKNCCLIKDDNNWLDLINESDFETEAETYLSENCNNPEIDGRIILEQWKPMCETLGQYLLSRDLPTNSEDLIKGEVMSGYWAAGSADAYDAKTKTLIDFKTTSDKTPKNYVPMNYKYQLLTYAWIYTQMGMPVERIKIVWITRNETGRVSEKTGKPLKDYPSQVGEAVEVVTPESMNFIESILKLISESVQATKDHPELTHVIWKDYRLKPFVKPELEQPKWATE